MSKKNRNYTNYPKPQAKPVESEVVEEVVEPEVPTPVIGVVTGCEKLNVRAAANTGANVVCIIAAGDEVEINEEESTNDFYAVYTGTGAEGYCMKKFITIK